MSKIHHYKDVLMKFYHEKEQLYLETYGSGVGLGAGLMSYAGEGQNMASKG